MPFLDIKEGKVFVTEEGKEIPAVKSLYAGDKTQGKVFFNDAITYIFFVYNQSGVYKDQFDQHRREMVIKRHLPKRSIDDFEVHPKVKALIGEYLDRQMTKLERLYYKLAEDMEKLLERIHNIPYTKKVKAQVPFTNADVETTMVSAEVEIENYEEKSKAILMAEKLVDYEGKLKNKILKEKIEKKKSKGRIFDKKNVGS